MPWVQPQLLDWLLEAESEITLTAADQEAEIWLCVCPHGCPTRWPGKGFRPFSPSWALWAPNEIVWLWPKLLVKPFIIPGSIRRSRNSMRCFVLSLCSCWDQQLCFYSVSGKHQQDNWTAELPFKDIYGPPPDGVQCTFLHTVYITLSLIVSSTNFACSWSKDKKSKTSARDFSPQTPSGFHLL